MIKKYKTVFLDIWETVLFNNDNDINIDRGQIIYELTKYKTVEFWKSRIEKEITEFKRNELKGFTVQPKERIKKILGSEYFGNTELVDKIINKFNELIINKYPPTLNDKLINEIREKYENIIILSNTGLTSKECIIRILKMHNIHNMFKDMFFSEDYKFCKPNVLFYKIPIDKYNLDVEDIIMYGDSEIMDLEPCEELKIKCIIKNWRKLYNEND